MKQKRSEIFESFAKIAVEKGLIEVNAESRTEEEKLKDSNYKANIKALYNVDIDSGDLFEKAHPKSVIVSPSYDKVNGLFENERERHNIMVGIALKQPSGNLLGQKYADAHDDLLGELVRLGFSMDNKNIDDLRILADSCSERITKKAFLPLIAGGIAATLALIAIINHTSPSDQGVYNNCEKAIVEIKEVKPKLPQISDRIDKLLSDLNSLQELSHEYNSLGSIDASTTEKLVDAANKHQDKISIAKKYKTACAYMSGEILSYISLINSYKMTEERNYDWWQKIKNVTELLTGNDKEDAVLALQTLQESLKDSVKEANQFMESAKEQEPSLMAAISNMPENAEKTESAPSKPAAQVHNQTHSAINSPAEHDDETAAVLKQLYDGHPVAL